MTAGRPGDDPGHRPLRGIPRSRAFWELKAEQMMNRLFEPAQTLELHDEPAEPVLPSAAARPPLPPPHRQAEARPGRPRRWRPGQAWLPAAALGGLGLVAALATALGLSQWSRLQQSLTQERNLLLLERLRSFGPATTAAAPPAPATPPAPVLPPPAGASAAGPEGLPPPPPAEEPWMQQLAQLPGPTGGPAPGQPAASPLRVPVSPALAAAAPRRPMPTTPPGPVPVLVGVVAAPGRAGSAIFQVGSLSTSAAVGETISGSGWRLRSAGSDSAVIEHDGITRTLSIGNGG